MYLLFSSHVYRRACISLGLWSLIYPWWYTLSGNFTGGSLWSGTQLEEMLCSVTRWGPLERSSGESFFPWYWRHTESSVSKQKGEDHIRQVTSLIVCSWVAATLEWEGAEFFLKKALSCVISGSLADWRSVVVYLQWNSLRGNAERWSWNRGNSRAPSPPLSSPPKV